MERLALAGLLGLLFLLSVVTYNHLHEDAFITFRYVRNFAAGRGLVFNPGGDWVEGYSNLLWALLLTPWEWAGVRLHLAARLMSYGFFAALVAGAWASARRLVPGGAPWWLRWWLPLALAFDPLLHYFDDSGLETMSFVALLGLAALAAGGDRPRKVGFFAGLAVITRPEGIAHALALMPAVAWAAARNAEPGAKREAAFGALRKALLLPVGLGAGQLVFRLIAYKEWLPNTLVAKTFIGTDPAQGFDIVAAFFVSRHFLPLIGAFGCLAGLLSARWRPLAIAAGGAWGAALFLSCYGAARVPINFRYMAPLVVPSIIGCWLLAAFFWEKLRDSRPNGKAGPLALVLAATLWALVPPLFFRQAQIRESFYGRYAVGNQDHPKSRFLQRLIDPDCWNLAERWDWFLSDPIHLNAEAGRWLRANLPADAKIAIDQAGMLCFCAGPEQSFIDLIGLNDWRVARFGVSEGDLIARAPEYLVLMCYGRTPFEPEAKHFSPVFPGLKPAHEARGWRQRWALSAKAGYFNWAAFVVYVRSDLDDFGPLELVELGVPGEEYQRRWRLFDD